ncbi:hypothetical protein ACIRPT_21575 [Streptomyces sp. NPDC101227]|uniref:hypothetical protein n=1 Tax=Streptomyces sp. NPDC101227 TaxID=3366136 RepID=UPI00381B84AC
MSSEIPEGLPPLQIHVLSPDEHDGEHGDVPLTDVGVVNLNGERHLFLSPQSFGSAVRQVSSAMPDLPLEQVERLVREHCAEFKDFDELLGPVEPAPPVDLLPPPAEPPASARPRGRAKRWAIAAALLPALAGSWAVGHFTGHDVAETRASAPDVSPNSTEASDRMRSAAQPFNDPMFMDFSDAGQIDCQTLGTLQAECTDSDGMVMSSKAALGPDSTIFTFSYGAEQIGLRIFGDPDYAKTWTQQDGTTKLYPNLVRSGRYVLWGTDKDRLQEYLKLLHTSSSKKLPAGAHAMGNATPLPPRLAALTLGTLGLNEHDVHTILFSPPDATADTPVFLAARAVLGVREDVPSRVKDGDDDIVALAAGIEPQPVATTPDQKPSTKPPVVQVTDSGSGSTSAGSSGASQATSTAPAPDPAPEPKPTEEEQKPVEEKPKDSEQPVTDPTPSTDTQSEPAQPEQREQPTEPPAGTVVPAPSSETRPAPPKEPGPADPQVPAEGAGGTHELGLPGPGNATPVEDGDEDGDLMALPQAWIAAA